MQHPDLIILMERSKRRPQTERPQLPPDDRPSPLSTIRTRTGNALIALGTRIAPAPQRPLPGTSPRPAIGS